MEIEFAIGIAAILMVTYVSFLFLCKIKEVTVTTRTPPRKRIFTVPIPDIDPQRKLANDLIMSRLGLTRDDGCVITISIDKQVRLYQSVTAWTPLIIESELFLTPIHRFNYQKLQSFGSGENSLSVLNSFATVFLLLHATTDDEESKSYEQYNALNISNPIPRHRFLFYQTPIGKIAIIRQLKSQLHVDFEATICTQIAPHIKSTIYIDEKDHKSSVELALCKKIKTLDDLILMTSLP